MALKEVFCQNKAVDILQKAFASGKIPHAYIFAGMEGVGKFKTAREWAKLLLCKNPLIEDNFADSCSRCQSCLLFETGSHPDFNPVYKELLEFTRDGKDRTTPVELPIDVIREFLIEKVSTKPTLSERKVFVVAETEKLNAASQNSLLKVLEEPPGYCCIILLCTSLEKLLPTTRSRCQIIRFAPIDQEKITEKLKQIGVHKAQAEFFARLAQGSLGLASQWAELELADANLYDTKKQLVKSLSTLEYADALNMAQSLLGESNKIAAAWAKLQTATSKTDINRRAQKTIFQMVISALLDAMKLNLAGTEKIINFDQLQQIKILAERFSPEQAAEKIAEVHKTMLWIDSNVNEKLIFEQFLLNLAVSDRIKA